MAVSYTHLEKVQSFYRRSLDSAQNAFEAIKKELTAGTDTEELARQLYDQYMTCLLYTSCLYVLCWQIAIG